MSDHNLTKNKKRSFLLNLKIFSSRAKQKKKHLFYFPLFIILFLSLFTPNYIVPFIKAAAAGQSIQSTPPSFTFTAGGDIGGNTQSSASLDMIASSGSNFHLVLGDLSYSEITPESAWCSYVQSHVGSNFPFELISGNHEDGGESQDGLIDNFVQCLPDMLGAVGTYGKEFYFDYPAASPIARFMMISPGLTFTNGGTYDYSAGTAHYNWVSDTIDNARAAGIKWIIVGMHKNCISMGIMPCDIGNDLFNLLVSKKVDLILQGHDHDYQRSKQLALNGATCPAIQAETYNSNCVVNDGSTGNYTQGSGPVLVIVGTVGEGLHTINTSDGDAGYFASWMGGNVNATNGLTKFTLSSDQLTVSANFMGTGPSNFTDSFSITSPTATPTPSPTATATPTLTPTATPSPTPSPTATATPTAPPGGIWLRAAASANNGAGGSSLTINVPTGTASGDVMLAHVVVRTAGNAMAAPAGWNMVLRQDTSSAVATATYVKVAGAAEPASYSWSFGTAGEASGGIASYVGVNTSAPIDASHAQYNNSVSNVDNSGVTTTVANDMLVYAVGIVTATTVNVPTGFTQEWRTASNTSTTSEMSQELLASAGATGTIHGTLSSATSNITYLIALRSAGAASPPPPSGIWLRAGAAANNGAGGSSLTINVPTGTSSGDVMVAFVVVRTAGNVITPPAGWSLVLRQDSGSALSTVTYVKVAGAAESASYSWSFGTAGEASGWIADYVGVSTSTPVDASHGQYNASTSNVDNSGVTTTAANDMLVYGVGIIIPTTVNVPSGFTEECYSASNSATTAEMSQELYASAGATGTIHGTHNGGSNSNITQLIALKPA